MTPTFSAFQSTYLMCASIGDTFDKLPALSRQKPFFFVGESYLRDGSGNDLHGEVEQVIHVWSKRTERSIADKMAVRLHDALQSPIPARAYHLRLIDYNSRLIPTHAEDGDWLHTVINLRFQYTKRSDS